MNLYVLPLTADPRQVFLTSLTVDGEALQLRVEVRWLPFLDVWILSLWDDSTGDLWISQIPLIASYGPLNDLFRPFRHLRDGRGMGSCVVVSRQENPTTPDPSESSLSEFYVLLGDTLP